MSSQPKLRLEVQVEGCEPLVLPVETNTDVWLAMRRLAKHWPNSDYDRYGEEGEALHDFLVEVYHRMQAVEQEEGEA